MPPSTDSICPVTYAFSSRNNTAEATSSAVPTRGMLSPSQNSFTSFSESIIRKEIYEDGGEFFLYIEVEGLPSTAKKLILALNEFGEPCHIRREYLREHGKLLAKDPPIFG